MKLCRFNEGRLGVVNGEHVYDVTAALDVLPAYRYPLPEYDPLIANLDAVRTRATELARSASPTPLRSVRLLSPVANPGKIVCAPVNYQKHLEEVRDNAALHHNIAATMAPILSSGLFLKARSAIVGPGADIGPRKVHAPNG